MQMAEKALKKVEDQLNCSICLNVYTDPKLLHCFHVFCQTCLVRLVFRDEQGQLVLSCPNCRQITPVPANGVTDLQSAFLINHLLDITEDLRREITVPPSAESADSSPASLPPPQEEISLCSEHEEEKLKLYCETCGELICYQCGLKTGKHHNHDYVLLKEGFERYKKEINSSLDPIKKLLSSVDEVLAQFERCSGEISNQRAIIEADIHSSINELHQVLDIHRTELISCLHQLTQTKLKDLAAQRDHVETIHAQLKSCLDYMEKSIEAEHLSDTLKMKTTVVKQVEELTTTVQPATLQPNMETDIIFSASADIIASCRQFGKVALPSGSPDPSNCPISGKGLEVAEVGQNATAILQVFNSAGDPCNPAKALECKLVSDITGAEVAGSFKKLEFQNRYEICYQPVVKGQHQLHTTIEGHHIRGSPFSVAVTSSSLGQAIHSIGSEGPYGIAINHKSEIVVSETGGRDRISVFSSSGKKIRTIRVSGLGSLLGDGNGNLCGLTYDGDGNILVGEEKKHSIKRYSPEGKLLASVGSEGTGQLQFKRPHAIAFSTANGKVYIADCSNHRIQVLNSDLTFSAVFGEYGEDEGQFKYPGGITCDSAGNVYVADSNNHRIQVFTAEGKFLKMFGHEGNGSGELGWPIGIALDLSNNYVFVSEYSNQRVSVFNFESQFVASFSCAFFPRGLTVDNCGVIYVCDRGGNCVQVY